MINISNLDDNEVSVLLAAFVAMVHDIHAPQDQLSDDEWIVAEKMSNVIEEEANRRNSKLESMRSLLDRLK